MLKILAIVLRKSPVASSMFGVLLALLVASPFPLWTKTRSSFLPVQWVSGDFWGVFHDLREAIDDLGRAGHRPRAKLVLQQQWGNLLVTAPILTLGAVAGLLLHRLYHKRKGKQPPAPVCPESPVETSDR
jgi:hypothetical protein